MEENKILIVDFGGQYSQIIARRIREFKVYCEVVSFDKAIEAAKTKPPTGIVLSGGPSSIYKDSAPKIDKSIFKMKIPILGICYGAQLIAHELGGKVQPAKNKKEYGKVFSTLNLKSPLFKNTKKNTVTWMSHTDHIEKPPENFEITSKSENGLIASIEDSENNIFAVQFHPEVEQTEVGKKIIENFLFEICKASATWRLEGFLEKSISKIITDVKNEKVLLALSGGVDSSVLAAMLSKAIGRQLHAVFIDHGFMRKNEADLIENCFANWNMNFIRIDAKDRFLEKLKDISNPEEKRKIIGKEFIEVFQQTAEKLGNICYLAQGTIYPDIIESGIGLASKIKSHHNVGGLPKNMKFKKIIEPLKTLFKDEVRKIGLALNLPSKLVNRQPFPGPGLAIRIIGTVTKEKLKILKDADQIFKEEVEKLPANLVPDQYFAVLTSTKSVGVMGDFRTYSNVLALRAIETSDFMTATFSKLPYETLEKTASRIASEVGNINRVVYDISTKPPATIEFE